MRDTYKRQFIDAVNGALAAIEDDSNDDEIARLWEAVEVARDWLSVMDIISHSEYADGGADGT